MTLADFGCPQCGVIPLGGPHICEHGVTPQISTELEITQECDAETSWRLLYGDAGDDMR